MKQILTAALLLLAMTASAQKNPMRGYVVTLQNDTLRGTVDYLSGTKNAWTCLFRRDGVTHGVCPPVIELHSGTSVLPGAELKIVNINP